MPVSFVTDMRINTCSNELYCSTWGRGLWKTVLPSITENPLFVSSNSTWNGVYDGVNDIVVNSGVILTVTGEITMHENKKIIVKPYAKLIIDGGTITNACNDFWQGIEVQGNSALCQYPVL